MYDPFMMIHMDMGLSHLLSTMWAAILCPKDHLVLLFIGAPQGFMYFLLMLEPLREEWISGLGFIGMMCGSMLVILSFTGLPFYLPTSVKITNLDQAAALGVKSSVSNGLIIPK
jgi:hypothetical protein